MMMDRTTAYWIDFCMCKWVQIVCKAYVDIGTQTETDGHPTCSNCRMSQRLHPLKIIRLIDHNNNNL